MEKSKNKSKNFFDWAIRVNFSIHFLLVNLFCIGGLIAAIITMPIEEIVEDAWVSYAVIGIVTLITAIQIKWWTFLPMAFALVLNFYLGYLGLVIYFLSLVGTIYWLGRYDHYKELTKTGQA